MQASALELRAFALRSGRRPSDRPRQDGVLPRTAPELWKLLASHAVRCLATLRV